MSKLPNWLSCWKKEQDCREYSTHTSTLLGMLENRSGLFSAVWKSHIDPQFPVQHILHYTDFKGSTAVNGASNVKRDLFLNSIINLLCRCKLKDQYPNKEVFSVFHLLLVFICSWRTLKSKRKMQIMFVSWGWNFQKRDCFGHILTSLP